jgi:hypothetical protein
MVRGENRARTGLSSFLLASSALVWVSSVIVMGILAYLVSRGWGGDHIIYELVIVRYNSIFSSLAPILTRVACSLSSQQHSSHWHFSLESTRVTSCSST